MNASAQKNIAADFVFEYPFALFLRGHIDPNTACIKPQTDIRFAIVGGGALAREIFLASAETNVFVSRSDDKIAQHRVGCHIFDDGKDFRVGLADGYYRYKNEFFDRDGSAKCDPSEYLPLPEYPTADEFHSQKIGSKEFFDELSAALRLGHADENLVRFVAVCTEDSAVNERVARRILAMLDETRSRAAVFVACGMCDIFERNDCFRIAATGNGVEFSNNAAIVRDAMYVLESSKGESLSAAIAEARAAFGKKTRFERELNTYACLALRAKLLLLGFDISSIDGDVCLETFAKTACTEPRRTVLAVQEHCRWNAHMLVCGYVPASISEILHGMTQGGKKHANGKNAALRTHGNLTDFDGLREFAKMIAARDGCSEESADVIKYDYQIIDGACELLAACGYSLKRL